jgi:transcriptional regulator with XRE-family HTH domain
MGKQHLHEKIRDIRKARGATQEEVADVLGMSRTSYIAFEKGERELTVNERDLFESKYGRIDGEDQDYAKYRDMLVAFLRAFNGEAIPKTKLAKLLYLADFAWFYEHAESMSNMQYRRIQYGPVPDAYFRIVDELEGEGIIRIKHEERPDNGVAYMISESPAHTNEKLTLVSEAESALIENIAEKWKDARTSEIVNFTHRQLPYTVCKENEVIPYPLIVMEDPDKVY